MTPDVAEAVRTSARSAALTGGVAACVLVAVSVGLFVAGGIATMVSVPVAVIALCLLALAWSSWSRARTDLASGLVTRATGSFTLIDRTYSSGWGFSRTVHSLRVGEAKLALSATAADAVRSHSGPTKWKRSLWSGDGSDQAFLGIIEYAQSSRRIMTIMTASGRVLWRDPRLHSWSGGQDSIRWS